jgi:hypothetical protein
MLTDFIVRHHFISYKHFLSHFSIGTYTLQPMLYHMDFNQQLRNSSAMSWGQNDMFAPVVFKVCQGDNPIAPMELAPTKKQHIKTCAIRCARTVNYQRGLA